MQDSNDSLMLLDYSEYGCRQYNYDLINYSIVFITFKHAREICPI